MFKIVHPLRNSKLRFSNFHTSVLRSSEGKNVPKTSPETKPPPTTRIELGKDYFAPNAMDKVILVWAKKYKSKAEIPTIVPMTLYNHARNVARIKLANYTMVFILIGCCFSVAYGKYQARQGNTLQKRAMDWHEQIKAEHARELEEKNNPPKKS